MTKLPDDGKKFKYFFLLEIKIELKKVSWVKPFLMSVLSYHEFRVLKAVFMFEVDSIFHFMEFGAHFLAELELISLIEDGEIVF